MSGGAFTAVLRRDLLLAMRRKSEVLTAVFFLLWSQPCFRWALALS